MGKLVSQMTPEEHKAAKAKDCARKLKANISPERLEVQREQKRRAAKVYREKNREALRLQAYKYRPEPSRKPAMTREEFNARRRELRRSNINERLINNMRRRFNHLRANKDGKATLDCIDYTIGELRYHIATRFERGMSWDNWGEWQIDHIVPCSAFDHSDPEQVRECWKLSNLQPLWAYDNNSKGAKVI